MFKDGLYLREWPDEWMVSEKSPERSKPLNERYGLFNSHSNADRFISLLVLAVPDKRAKESEDRGRLAIAVIFASLALYLTPTGLLMEGDYTH